METIKIPIDGEFIRLDELLKLSGVAPTGGQAKLMVQSGKIKVNEEICKQRGKKITREDRIWAGNIVIEAT